MPEVTVNHKAYPNDGEFELPGLGVFKNGQTKFVEPGNIQGWINAGLPWPNDNPNQSVVLNLPPKPVEEDDEPPENEDGGEEADGTVELTKEDIARMTGEDDEENN